MPVIAGTTQYFDEYVRWQFADGAQLDSGNVKFALFTNGLTPDPAAQSVLADIVAHELSHASYTAGGVALASPAVSQSGGIGKFTSDGVSIPFVGANTAAKWGVFYLAGTVGALTDPLIGYFALDTDPVTEDPIDLVILAGYAFVLNMPAPGWLTWSQT